MSFEESAGVETPEFQPSNLETQTAELDAANADAQNTGESSAPEEHEDGQLEKPPRGVQKRLNELTREKYEERRRADKLEAMLEQIIPRLLPQDQPQQTRQADQLAKPDPNQYPAGRYDPDYIEALTDYKLAQQFESQRQRQAQESQAQAQARQQAEILQREKEYAQQHPEYAQAREELLRIPQIANHPGIGYAVANSDNPPALIHWLWEHPDEALKIASAEPMRAAMLIGRAESEITGSKARPTELGIFAKTKAPRPIDPVTGTGGRAITSSDQARTMEEYVKLREKELGGRRL